MIRCPSCGHTNRWSPIAIQPCRHCGTFLVMPDEATAKSAGLFEGVDPPYTWEVTAPEVTLIFDGLDCLMEGFKMMLRTTENANPQLSDMLSGSYVFAKMTRQRLWKVVPDLQEQLTRPE